MPQEQVVQHLDGLLAAGANVAGIAEASGLPVRTLFGIRNRKWVQGETAAALLAVRKAPALPPTGFRPAAGACRRVRALLALGWPLTEQGRRIGMFVQQLSQIANGKVATVSVGTYEAVAGLFEQLSSVPGPSVRAKNQASRVGWLPPLAWDDIDNPDEEPAVAECADDTVDEVAVERVLAGERIHLNDAELVAAVQIGQARGLSLSSLADLLGVSDEAARVLSAGQLPPLRAKHARVDAEVRRVGHLHDTATLARMLGVHHTTVARSRVRVAGQAANRVEP